MTQRLSRILSAVGLATMLAACGGSDTATVNVSARLAGTPLAQVAANALTVAGGRVEIQDVWMVIRDIKFGVPGAEGEINASNGPFLLAVSGAGLSGPVTQEFTVEVRTGTYDELRFIVHKLEDQQTVGVPELDGPRASLAIRMSVDGSAPLTFTSELNEAQRIAGRFVVEDGQAPDNITISIDPAGWFTGSGGFLDPRVDANRQAIEDNIRVSIDAFEDDDHNGLSDDGPNHT
jgi:hypothetical protein